MCSWCIKLPPPLHTCALLEIPLTILLTHNVSFSVSHYSCLCVKVCASLDHRFVAVALDQRIVVCPAHCPAASLALSVGSLSASARFVNGDADAQLDVPPVTAALDLQVNMHTYFCARTHSFRTHFPAASFANRWLADRIGTVWRRVPPAVNAALDLRVKICTHNVQCTRAHTYSYTYTHIHTRTHCISSPLH